MAGHLDGQQATMQPRERLGFEFGYGQENFDPFAHAMRLLRGCVQRRQENWADRSDLVRTHSSMQFDERWEY